MKCYMLTVMIYGFKPANMRAIKRAANELCAFGDWTNRGSLRSSVRMFLDNAEKPEELVEHLSLAVWQANGEFCPVSVIVSREHLLDRDAYSRLVGDAAIAVSDDDAPNPPFPVHE